jgi:hypothetical protein
MEELKKKLTQFKRPQFLKKQNLRKKKCIDKKRHELGHEVIKRAQNLWNKRCIKNKKSKLGHDIKRNELGHDIKRNELGHVWQHRGLQRRNTYFFLKKCNISDGFFMLFDVLFPKN